MTRCFSVFMFSLFIFWGAVFAASAQVPFQINHQGRLTDTGGTPVPDNHYSMTFAIYDTPSGGTPLWIETRTTGVVNGVYSILLGLPGNQILPSVMDGDRYLGIRVETEDEMTPRQRISSSAFSLRAAVADDADTLDGMDSQAFGDITEVTAGTGLTGGGTAGMVTISADTLFLQRRVSGACPEGSSIRSISSTGSVVCEPDDNSKGDITGVTAGSGLTGGGDSGALTIHADFAGTGSASTIARSDHHHDSRYYTETEVKGLVAGLQSQIDDLRSTVNTLSALLAGAARNGKDITFSGVNIRIVNGTGSTSGTVNGLGNLIVGYDEARSSGSDKTGSHNIVVGRNHNYSSYGGLVAGYQNTISDYHACVSGGYNNTASEAYASVTGGQSNTASGNAASVTAGYGNTADGSRSSISGGYGNTANGYASGISSGRNNTAEGSYSSISGGRDNEADGGYCSIAGGQQNLAAGDYAFVGGGGGTGDHDGNIAFAHYSAILGGRNNLTGDGERNGMSGFFELTPGTDHTMGIQATVSGGHRNWAQAESSSISGGRYNEATGQSASVSGGVHNHAQGYWSSISGGENNQTTDLWASISGGGSNRSAGARSSVSGGYWNRANGDYSSVSGGYRNTAESDYSSISGGYKNTASGNYSSISGGNTRSVSGAYDWRAGADYFSDD